MGTVALILGASGTGKSTSLRNFRKGEIGVLNVASKRLPFRAELDTANTSDYEVIKSTLMKNTFRAYAIDDSQYLMAFENMARAYEKGYDKFVQMAVNFRTMLDVIIRGTNNDTIVYLLHHPEFDDYGHMKAKTAGKMLDTNLGGIEGMVPITLIAQTDGEHYTFITNGMPPAKTPIGMFADKEIPNDLKAVDAAIREYWNLKPLTDKTKEKK